MRTTKKFLRKLDQIFNDTYPVIHEDENAIVRQFGIGDYRIDWKNPLSDTGYAINFDGTATPDIDRLKNEILMQIKAELK